MNLGDKLREVLGSQEKDYLAFLALHPSGVDEAQKELKEGHWKVKNDKDLGRPLLHPEDRERFINWGKNKIKNKKDLTEGIITLSQELNILRPRIATAAQEIYDGWDQTDDNDDFGGGGICDSIASAMADVIAGSIDCHIDDGGHEGGDHAFLIVSRANERYWVDIPPSMYEKGGGYSWSKIHDVEIHPDDVVIEPI
jgi:hypothetical protein